MSTTDSPPQVDILATNRKIKKRRNLGKIFITTAVLIWFSLLILLPLGSIVKEAIGTGKNIFADTFNTPESSRAFYLTLIITIVAVVLNTIIGVILAIVFSRQRFKGQLLVESIIDLPFAISPVVAGLMFIILFGPNGWIGSWFEARNIKIIYALPGMMIATIFVTFPFVVREILPILREFGQEQEESAATLGASRWQTFFRVTLPSIKWGLAYGITLTISRSIGEFGAVLVVSGSIINKTQTATLRIHDQFSDLNYAGAFSGSLVLALASFIILCILQFLYKKRDTALHEQESPSEKTITTINFSS